MDCFNFTCPFRQNETSSANRCECIACPNRDSHVYTITFNRTLSDEEISDLKLRLEDPDYGVGIYS